MIGAMIRETNEDESVEEERAETLEPQFQFKNN